MQSYKENARIAQELAAKVSEITVLREETEKNREEVEKLTLTLEELGTRNRDLLEQVEEEKNSCRVLHVELDTIAEEKSAVEKSLDDCKEENRKMVEMIIEMKEKEAERMNAANDYYDSVVSNANLQAMRRMSMEPGGRGSPCSWKDADSEWQGLDNLGICLPKSVKHILSGAHTGTANACCFSNKGTLMATGGADQIIKVWEPKKGAATSTLQGTLGSVLDVRFTPDDQFMVAAGADGALRMWNVESGRSKHTLTGHKDKVHSVSFASSDSKRCVSGGQDRTIRIWDLVKGYCIQTIACGSTCFGVAMSQNGSFIYSGHFDGSVRVWDYRTGSLEKQLSQIHTAQISSLVISPVSDRYLVTAGKDNTVTVVDLVNFETAQVLEAPGLRMPTTPCISPDDATVCCGGSNGTVFLWSTRTGRVEGELKKHKAPVLATAWAPNSSMVVSTDQKGGAIVWD